MTTEAVSARRLRVLAAIAQGQTLDEIREAEGISKSALQMDVLSLGMSVQEIKWEEAQLRRRKVGLRYAREESVESIAEVLGIDIKTVKKDLKTLGLTVKKPDPGKGPVDWVERAKELEEELGAPEGHYRLMLEWTGPQRDVLGERRERDRRRRQKAEGA